MLSANLFAAELTNGPLVRLAEWFLSKPLDEEAAERRVANLGDSIHDHITFETLDEITDEFEALALSEHQRLIREIEETGYMTRNAYRAAVQKGSPLRRERVVRWVEKHAGVIEALPQAAALPTPRPSRDTRAEPSRADKKRIALSDDAMPRKGPQAGRAMSIPERMQQSNEQHGAVIVQKIQRGRSARSTSPQKNRVMSIPERMQQSNEQHGAVIVQKVQRGRSARSTSPVKRSNGR